MDMEYNSNNKEPGDTPIGDTGMRTWRQRHKAWTTLIYKGHYWSSHGAFKQNSNSMIAPP